ncbi:CrcB family protein [Citricoccus sp. NPDC055426]|uniref:CrcB family protein n=1 Tax=Citricoccus sp. NPDC055426 TaxID=3155536 RepID=UPI003430EEE8
MPVAPHPLPAPSGPGPRHPGWPVVGAVAVGGVLGTLLRWALVAPAPESGTPVAQWITLGLVNLSGAFLLGVLSGIGFRSRLPRWLLVGLGTGVLGSYTSLSAVVLAAAVAPAVGVADFIQTGSPGGWLLVAGLAGTLLALAAGAALGTMAAAAGLHLGGFRAAPRPGGRSA